MSAGLFWLLLRPALLALVLAIVFGSLFAEGDGRYPYLAYLLAALVPWSVFDEAVRHGARTYLSNGSLLRSQKTSGGILGSISAFEGSITSAAAITILWLGYLVLFRDFSASDFWIPALLILQFMTLWGIILWASLIVTLIRDAEPLIDPVMMVTFWSAPIVYYESILPGGVQKWLPYWPPAAWTRLWRSVLGYGQQPALSDLAVTVVTALVAAISGMLLTRFRFNLVADAT